MISRIELAQRLARGEASRLVRYQVMRLQDICEWGRQAWGLTGRAPAFSSV